MHIQERTCVWSSSQKGWILQPADFYGIGFSVAEGKALPTFFPTALVFLFERKQLHQTVNDKIYSGKISDKGSH